jgi:hypothetical protein
MKRILGILTILAAVGLFAAPAEAQFKIYGSYWSPGDLDEVGGGGLGFGIPFGESGFSLDLAATYYQELSEEPLGNVFDDDEGVFRDEGLEVLPVDVGIHYNFARNGMFSPWIGAGGTYFMIDTTRNNFEIDDETGFHVSAGTQIGQRDGVNFFAEAIYRSTESTLRRDEDDVPDPSDAVDEVDIDLDGIAVNAGLSWRF